MKKRLPRIGFSKSPRKD